MFLEFNSANGYSISIIDPECTPNFFPDYREHLTEDENVRWTNRICADGTWEANLFNFYQRVLPRLQSVTPKPFKLEGNTRKEETPAHIAVREALINLCVHADYTEDASLVVGTTQMLLCFQIQELCLFQKNNIILEVKVCAVTNRYKKCFRCLVSQKKQEVVLTKS